MLSCASDKTARALPQDVALPHRFVVPFVGVNFEFERYAPKAVELETASDRETIVFALGAIIWLEL